MLRSRFRRLHARVRLCSLRQLWPNGRWDSGLTGIPTPTTQPANKTLRTKKTLAKRLKQNRPIPQWIRMRTGNRIRSVLFHCPASYEASALRAIDCGLGRDLAGSRRGRLPSVDSACARDRASGCGLGLGACSPWAHHLRTAGPSPCCIC